jgi:hypothetical protein
VTEKQLEEKFKALSESQMKVALAEIYRSSLYYTCKSLLGMTDINLRTHGSTIAALEELQFRKKNISNALIIMPRGSLKSSICSIAFPIWRLINDWNKRILIDSATYDLSTQILAAIAQHLESEAFTSIFGVARSKDDWSSKSLTINQRTKILKESSLVASGVGSPKTGAHYDIIIMDDLNNEKNSATVELRDKVFKHYQMNYAILDPGGDTVVVATRYSSDDIPGRVLEQEINVKGWS